MPKIPTTSLSDWILNHSAGLNFFAFSRFKIWLNALRHVCRSKLVEILPEPKNVTIGGGGPPTEKPVQIEVYTSGIDGTYILIILSGWSFALLFKTKVLNVSQSREDFSFCVYASLSIGDAVPNPSAKYKTEATIRKASTGNSELLNYSLFCIFNRVFSEKWVFLFFIW